MQTLAWYCHVRRDSILSLQALQRVETAPVFAAGPSSGARWWACLITCSTQCQNHFVVQLCYFTLLSPLSFVPDADLSNSVQVNVFHDVLDMLALWVCVIILFIRALLLVAVRSVFEDVRVSTKDFDEFDEHLIVQDPRYFLEIAWATVTSSIPYIPFT